MRSLVIVLVIAASWVADPTERPREAAQAAENAPYTLSQARADLATFPLSFIANAGQLSQDVRFHVRGMGGDLYFTSRSVFLVLPTPDDFATVQLNFVGANPAPMLATAAPLPGVVNYFYGNDPAQWITNVPTYGGIMYELLYPGITLHYDGTHGTLKGTYWIAPGANPQMIRWRYDGVTQIQPDPATGDLHLMLPGDTDALYLTELAPLAWQEIDGQEWPVDVAYTVYEDQSIGFTLGGYDPAHVLYLDPSLQYGSYFGGPSIEEGQDIAIDVAGNVYITGRTDSTSLPDPLSPPAPPFQENLAGDSDAFVAKFSMSNKQLVYATYLGGPDIDYGYGIAVDVDGNAFITGETASTTFPRSSPDVYQYTHGGGVDAFVTKLNSTGSALIYSTFLGGSSVDRAYAVALDSSGLAYIAGETASNIDFPIVNALSGGSTYGGGTFDGFITRFNATGTDVTLSTFFGGNDVDRVYGIVVDASSYVYIAGRTDSVTGFPLQNADQSAYGSNGDGFVARFSAAGAPSLIYSTYLGGSELDEARAIAVGTANKAYVTGDTASTNFPRQNALYNDRGGTDAFVTVYSATGVRAYSTYLGGEGEDTGSGIGLDGADNIYVVGQTLSQAQTVVFPDGFPIVEALPDQSVLHDPTGDAYLTKIVAAGTSIQYSTYLGGDLVDVARDVAVSAGGSAYVTGETLSTNFPTKDGLQRSFDFDAFVVRVGDARADVSVSKNDIGFDPVSVGQTMTYTIAVTNRGPDPSNVTMNDALSVYVTYVSATSTKGTCTYDDGARVVSCALGAMIANETATISLEVTLTTAPPVLLFNTATITGSEYDNITTNNTDSEPTQISNQADLQVTKTADAYRTHVGDTVHFFIQLENLGPGAATGISLQDVLPAEVTYVSHVAPAGTTYNSSTGLWTVGDLSASASKTLEIVVTIDPMPVGTVFTNTADNLVSVEVDPVAENDSSSIELRIVTDFPDEGCHTSPNNPNEVICLTG
jgi:uncharacterized repeat protein (TIGR01451 family)